MNKEIEIPEGYEARIEGNKVILECKMSEDERIRKELMNFVAKVKDIANSGRDSWAVRKEDIEMCERFLAYLEKQKGQKPAGIDEHEIIKKHITEDSLSSEVNKRLKECGWYVTYDNPAEWSEEEKGILRNCISALQNSGNWFLANKLKHLRPQPKQESEPIEIKFAGKIYKVYGIKELQGGVVGYIIEDEPGHYDCIIHPDEVLGGGYGIKSNGSPYPTKEANFGQPHWKPSEEQIKEYGYWYRNFIESGLASPTSKAVTVLGELLEQLEKLYSL